MSRGHTAVKKTKLDAGGGCEAKPTLGFGVPATSDPHHFKVGIPPANSGKVQISEYLGMQASSDEFAVMDRVVLDRPRWTAIRSEVQRAFNAQLKAHDLKTSAWKVGENRSIGCSARNSAFWPGRSRTWRWTRFPSRSATGWRYARRNGGGSSA
jgi:hypothetical protein